MRYIIAGVEGSVSEIAVISSTLIALRQQSPRGYRHLEVVPLPLKGNHGHGQALVNRFSTEVENYINNPDNCVEETDEISKRLVCDYDDMDSHGINEASFRSSICNIGALPIISKPCFEYFPARLLFNKDELDHLLDSGLHLNDIIRRGIDRYNKTQTASYLKLDMYTKNNYRAKNWFWKLFDLNPMYLEKAKNMETDTNMKYYTEVPKLIKEISDGFNQ